MFQFKLIQLKPKTKTKLAKNKNGKLAPACLGTRTTCSRLGQTFRKPHRNQGVLGLAKYINLKSRGKIFYSVYPMGHPLCKLSINFHCVNVAKQLSYEKLISQLSLRIYSISYTQFSIRECLNRNQKQK